MFFSKKKNIEVVIILKKWKWENEIKSLRDSAHYSVKNMLFYNNEQVCRTPEILEATQTRLEIDR